MYVLFMLQLLRSLFNSHLRFPLFFSFSLSLSLSLSLCIYIYIYIYIQEKLNIKIILFLVELFAYNKCFVFNFISFFLFVFFKFNLIPKIQDHITALHRWWLNIKTETFNVGNYKSNHPLNTLFFNIFIYIYIYTISIIYLSIYLSI